MCPGAICPGRAGERALARDASLSISDVVALDRPSCPRVLLCDLLLLLASAMGGKALLLFSDIIHNKAIFTVIF